jgi:hypothetical protein
VARKGRLLSRGTFHNLIWTRMLSSRPYGTLGYKQLHSLGAGKDSPRTNGYGCHLATIQSPGKAANNVETLAIYANRRRSRSLFAGREEDLGSTGSQLEGDRAWRTLQCRHLPTCSRLCGEECN